MVRNSKANAKKNDLIEPFLDGTIHDTWHYHDQGEERFRRLYHEYNGFHELTQRDVKTRRLDSYAEILNNDEFYNNLDEKMNAYFDDFIDMFPYDRRVFNGANKAADLRISNPENFFKIVIDMIQRRFPGGNDGKIGDQDIRDLTACLRVIYKEDLWTLILRRRYSAIKALFATTLTSLLCAALILSCSDIARIEGFSLLSWGILAPTGIALLVIAIGSWFHYDFLANIKVKYESALKASASNLRNALHARLTEQVSLISQIMARINEEKWDLKSDNRLEEWPKMVTRWSKLAFWLSARVEAMEDFIQAQMWLVRRTHFGLRHLAGIITSFTRIVFILVTIVGIPSAYALAVLIKLALAGTLSPVAYWQGLFMAFEPVPMGLAALVFALNTLIGLGVIHAAQNYKLPEIELQDILQTDTMMGHKDTKLHDAIAALIKREKISILHGEDLSRGPNTR